MKQKIILSAILILICHVFAFADNERGYGFLMLEEPVGVRNISMGSAGTALGGDGFYYYNPAVPFFSAYPHASIEFAQMPGGVNKGGFESAFLFPQWFTAVGFYSSSVDFETRDERGFGSKASSSTTIGAFGAGIIRDNFAAGVSASMVQDRIWIEETYNAFTLSAGVGYKLFDNKLNLGAAGFHGFANSWRNSDDSYSSPVSVGVNDSLVPRFARAGAAWMDTVKNFPFTITTDIAYRDQCATLSVPVGAEVLILPSIALRIGKRFGWESEIFSIGLGLNIDKVSFDAAFVPSVFVDDYELKWSMGLRYNMGGKRKKDRVESAKSPQEDVDKIDIMDEIIQPRETIESVLDEVEEELPHSQEEVELDVGEQESVDVDESVDIGGDESENDDDKQEHPQEEVEAGGQESDTADVTDTDQE
ncbi:MAG: hypothetical protein FWE57_01325 [Chitinispirillia bacterium]|nr:hypothetical protein [Chitinispirillia bacterium]